METVQIEDLSFTVRRSARRKTLGVTVERDGELVVSCPPELDRRLIESLVREKLPWVYEKLTEKELFFGTPRERRYVTGEGYHYLGRSYRLLFVEGRDEDALRDERVRLLNGRLVLRRSDRLVAEGLLVKWYSVRGENWIGRRVEQLAPRVGKASQAIRIRALGNRWGSCSPSGALNFHWRTVCLPPSLIEYIIVHEMVHLVERRHDRAFWTRLERILPDYRERRHLLARTGSEY